MLPPGYPVDANGKGVLSGVAAAKMVHVPCTTGGTVGIAPDLWYDPTTLTINYGVVETGPDGVHALGDDPQACMLWSCYATHNPLGGNQIFSQAHNSPYPGGPWIGNSFADLRTAAGKLMIDGWDVTVNEKIAARMNNGGAAAPLPNPYAEPADAAQAQAACAWDYYYSVFTQANSNSPPSMSPTNQEP